MDQLQIDPKLVDSIGFYLKNKGAILSSEELPGVVYRIRDEILTWYVNRLIHQVEAILEIDPLLSEREIFQILAKKVVEFLGAASASIHIYDPRGPELGASPASSESSMDPTETVLFEKAIGEEVLRTKNSFFVPNISLEPRFRNKEKAGELGFHSLLAVPIFLPRISVTESETQGVLQIFYREEDKVFSPVEIQVAQMFSRRVGYVIARKRILSLQKINLTRDRILEEIYLRLARREGIKMKDVFNSVIPELADIMKIQRCTLFSVTEDREHVVLEAGFPETEHGIGKVFSVQEPYIHAVVHQTGPFGDFENEKIYPSYILINNPQKSHLLPSHLKHFLQTQRINCVLYVPLHVDGIVQYFLAFDAQAHHQRFAEEEIMMFSFLGKELMKGLRLEKMDDILHDFKNPAIAIAGFAKRVQRLLEEGADPAKREKILQALDILHRESCRIQELALTLHGEGKESIIDLTEVLQKRFLINQEAIRELSGRDIRMAERQLESPLWIRCYPLHIERVLDNLLNNASHATLEGGELSIRSYRKAGSAVAEITNTGDMSAEEIERCLLGEGRGRGLHITTRLIKHMGAKMDVESKGGQTTFRLEIPLVNPQSGEQLSSPPA